MFPASIFPFIHSAVVFIHSLVCSIIIVETGSLWSRLHKRWGKNITKALFIAFSYCFYFPSLFGVGLHYWLASFAQP